MLELSPSVLSTLVLAALGLSGLVLLLLIAGAPRRRQRTAAHAPREDVADAVEEQGRLLAEVRTALAHLERQQREQAEVQLDAVQRVGLVRYDAFEDMGGQLSFSAALLDARGDGVVITSINGRQDTRCYAKAVRAGGSAHNLSEEEQQAIEEAVRGRRVAPAAEEAPGRRRVRRGA
jgi:uncharacterized protein YlxW (UPF0749 family)